MHDCIHWTNSSLVCGWSSFYRRHHYWLCQNGRAVLCRHGNRIHYRRQSSADQKKQLVGQTKFDKEEKTQRPRATRIEAFFNLIKKAPPKRCPIQLALSCSRLARKLGHMLERQGYCPDGMQVIQLATKFTLNFVDGPQLNLDAFLTSSPSSRKRLLSGRSAILI